MPHEVEIETDESIAFGDFVARLDAAGLDARDDAGLLAVAPLLRRLANNRHFLADIAIAELKARCRDQSAVNRYGAQVIMLHQPGTGYFVRANFWPAARDSIFRASGAAPFFYGVPHDHNFSFLTVGYLGPGYWSDYYDYDHDRVAGFAGETIDLRFLERSRLEPGRMLLYRAHRDVHEQHPPDAMSVSINIVQAGPDQPWLNQYRFDARRGEIAGILSTTPVEALLALGVHFGLGAGVDVATHFAACHPSDRVRFSAWRALASAEPDPQDRARVYARGAASPNRFIGRQCVEALRRLERALASEEAFNPAP